MTGLREALEKQLGSLPVMTHDNGYPVQAMPKAILLDLLALHPAEPAPIASRERVAEGLRLHLLATGPSDWDAADVKVCAESFTDALTAAGVFRDEATVKAELAELIAVRSQELIGGGPGGIAAAIAREAVTS